MKALYIILVFSFVTFSVLTSTVEDIVKEKYTSEIEEAKEMSTSIPLEIEAIEIELNNKEPKEILARLLHPYFCGSLGCSTYILVNENNTWREISPKLITHGDFEVTSKMANGFYSIKFGGNKVWRYNGKKYQ